MSPDLGKGTGVGNSYREEAQSGANPPSPGQSGIRDGYVPLYSMYSEIGEEEDNRLFERWRKDADVTLIFTGLFSAAVAALLTVTVPDLKPNSQDISAFYLQNMYQILAQANVSHPSIPSIIAKPPKSSPPRYAVWVNSLWFLSFVISITHAMLAMMLHQWAGQYIMITQQQRYNPQRKARVRAYFSGSLNGLPIQLMVEGSRVMIHLSLFLFFAGLTIFLFNTNHSVFGAVVWWMALSTATYIYITLLPIFRPSSPFHTPLSPTIWFLYSGMLYMVFGVLSRVFETSDCLHELKKYFHKRLIEGMGKTAEKTASQLSLEMDVRVLISTLGNQGEDGVGVEIFKAIPGIFNSHQVNNLEGHLLEDLRVKFSRALDGFLDRILSSDQVSESARSDQLMICLNATHVVLGVDGVSQILFNILDGRWKKVVQSVEMGHSLRRWSDSADQQYTPFVRGIVAQIIAGARARDDRWISLVGQEFGIPDQVLRGNIDDGDSAFLSVLLYMIRQARCTGSWTPWILSSLSQFDIRNIPPKLQHEFCSLWNDIVLEAQNNGADSISVLILKEIRHAYIRLHQGTDAPPTIFSDRTHHFDPVLTQPSTYRFCNIPDHLQEWAHQRPVTNHVTFPLPSSARSTSSAMSTTQLNDLPKPLPRPTPLDIQNFPDNADTFVIPSRTNAVHTTRPQAEEAKNTVPGFLSSADLAKRPPEHAPPRTDAFASPYQLPDPMYVTQQVLPVSEPSVPEGMGSVVAYEGTHHLNPLVSMEPYYHLPCCIPSTSESSANINLPSAKNDDNLPFGKPDTSDGASVNPGTYSLSAEDGDDKTGGAATKRQALLIGINYTGPHNKWSPLDGPHGDVDRYRELLITTYGYRPEDIIVLKDQPELPERYQPTRVNMIHELNALVADAAAGDRLTFFFSGHSDQQDAKSDTGEEDGLDEVLIASDEQPIIDNELREIFDLLPVGCSLIAILDTCHSGTLLDLPHYHCNSVYVPWQSKGECRAMTMKNINVCHQSTDLGKSTFAFQSIESQIKGQRFPDQLSNELPRIDIQLGRRHPFNQSETFPSRKSQESRRGRELEGTKFESQPRYASLEATFVCDGWCEYNDVPHANIIALSARSDLHRAWEGTRGSLTTVLCNYLKNNSYPSYGTLMSHINFQLHDNALALREYTRDQRKNAHRGQGDGFDGELDNFHEPKLSSLVRLNMDDILQL